MTDTTPSPHRAIAEALRLIADALEAQPVAVAAPSADDDTPTTIPALQALGWPVTPGWAKTAVEAVGRGPRQRLLYRPSDVRKALEAHPVAPRTRKCEAVEGESPIDAMLRSGQLIARRGAR